MRYISYLERNGVEQLPSVIYYKPAGLLLSNMRETILTIEEMEAIRLADIEQLEQETAAEYMEVPRTTSHRIDSMAHQKIAAVYGRGMHCWLTGALFVSRADVNKGWAILFVGRACGHKWTLLRSSGQYCNDYRVWQVKVSTLLFIINNKN